MSLILRAWNARQKFFRLLRYMLNIMRHSWPAKRETTGKIIFVHLTCHIKYRFVEQILRTLRAAGYTIYYYVSSVKDLMSLARLEGDLFWTAGVTITAVL